MDMPTLLDPEPRVLSTLRRDGSRRWLKPRLSNGKLLRYRRLVAYLLIATYTLLPHLQVGGAPAVLLDVSARRFTIAGFTFLPTDTLLLAVAMVGVLLGLFLLTALLGRVWCGWACPQTVYMEFVFRPIERLFERTVGRGGSPRRPSSGARVVLKYLSFLLLSAVLANTFLAYFVGAGTLWGWMGRSPVAHPGPFFLVAALTAAIMFNFSYFREQMCILACPYGRLQSVLLDPSSLIVSYDQRRGEPRGKKTRHLPVVGETAGDCVDCGLCALTCPTGIDIRDGLQMECVGCTQCIDACNAVMKKVGRPPSLIRFSSQMADQGHRRRILRPRVVIYPAIIAVLAGIFAVILSTKLSFDAILLRNQGHPFTTADDGRIRNVVQLKLTNRSDAEQRFEIEIESPAAASLEAVPERWVVPARETKTFPLSVVARPDLYIGARGKIELEMRVVAGNGDVRTVHYALLGPDTIRRVR